MLCYVFYIGDLNKWYGCRNGLREYVGVDIARQSLEDLIDRLVQGKNTADQRKLSRVICADMSKENLFVSEELKYFDNMTKTWMEGVPIRENEENTFDVISCQFAMHYMFQSYESADLFFSQVVTLK